MAGGKVQFIPAPGEKIQDTFNPLGAAFLVDVVP